MGSKLGCVILPGAIDAATVFAALRPVLDQWRPERVDCFVSAAAELPFGEVGTLVVTRSTTPLPGNSETAEVLSAELQTRALAVVINDFYQSAGFQLWDRGRSRYAMHLEHEMDVRGQTLTYLDVPALGLEKLFDTEIETSNRLLEDIFETASSGVDARLVHDGEVLERPAVSPGEPVEWEWKSARMTWPAGEVLARVKIHEADRGQ